MIKPLSGWVKNCNLCGLEFYVPNNRAHSAKYCSKQCKDKSNVIKITANCAICNNQFTHISSRCNKAKYCSRKCYYQGMKNRGSITKNCLCCGNEFRSAKSQKRIYCSKKCRGIGQRTESFKTNSGVRKALKRRGLLTKCSACGYDEFPDIIGVHHIDHNHKNNHISNLEVLCANCHSIRHLKHTPH